MGACTRRIAVVSGGIQASSPHAARDNVAAWCMPSPHAPLTRIKPLDSSAVELDVVFLGTSGSMPTAKRALSATLVRRGGDRLLFDCAEGTQRQLLRSDVGLVELE